jgi:hypothetical protein
MDLIFSLRYEPGRGRFAVATRDIPVGDVVCVERPCVSHILPEYMVFIKAFLGYTLFSLFIFI